MTYLSGIQRLGTNGLRPWPRWRDVAIRMACGASRLERSSRFSASGARVLAFREHFTRMMTTAPLANTPLMFDAVTAADRSSPLVETPLVRGESSNPEGIALLLQQELDLRHSVEGILVGLNWPHSAEIDRTLREQLLRLSANIAVLNQRYMIPALVLSAVEDVPAFVDQTGAGRSREILSLPDLIAQYRVILGTIGDLIAEGSDRERGKMILTQVALSHEEMATNLTTFLEEPSTFEHPSLTGAVVDVSTRGDAT